MALFGPNGAIWRTGKGGDTGNDSVSPPPPVTGSVTTQPVSATSDVQASPDILDDTRKATFDISGSVYTRFESELEKLKPVIPDPTMRMKSVVALLGVSPEELVSTLSTTHRGALDSWKASVENARKQRHTENIESRERQLEDIARDDEGIKNELQALQQKLSANSEKAAVLRQEIATAQSEIDAKAKQYGAAITATEAELGQIIQTLKSM